MKGRNSSKNYKNSEEGKYGEANSVVSGPYSGDYISRPAPGIEQDETYIVELFANYFHIFPSSSMSQEAMLERLGTHDRVYSQKWPQIDGSRFWVMRRKMSPIEIKFKMEERCPRLGEMWAHDRLRGDALVRRLGELKMFRVKLFVVHRFIGSMRVLPLVLDDKLHFCYDLSWLFREMQPPDGWGMIVEDIEDIGRLIVELLGELGVRLANAIQLIEYYSHVRLCACCGRIYDVTKKVGKLNWNRAIKSRQKRKPRAQRR